MEQKTQCSAVKERRWGVSDSTSIHGSGLMQDEWELLFWLCEHRGPHIASFYTSANQVAKRLHAKGHVCVRHGRRERGECPDEDYMLAFESGEKFVADYLVSVRVGRERGLCGYEAKEGGGG